MSKVLNSVIKFDLHIHSKASEYKESAGIVDHSTKENIRVLLSKLNQHNVALFSITDHNRFDPELYLEINKVLSQNGQSYPNVKAVLAGIEFDVKLNNGMGKCHIITIFDTKNESDKLWKIKNGLDKNLLEDVQGVYEKKEFDDILREIGLSTILIALQRKDINNHNGNHNSLSDSVDNIEHIIKVGYINALEFQKPKVEGILLNNLKELSLPVTLFSGSDCHDWTCYPYHSSENQNKEFYHSKAKIMPTFKGLLMAVTSPETRFNCSENTNTHVIESIVIKEKNIPLVNGINAIIGENGSGKTTLLKVINGKDSEAHVKKLIRSNNLKVNSSVGSQEVKYIEQGQIIKKFNEKTLFTAGDKGFFKELDSAQFRDNYLAYSNALKKNIEAHIRRKEILNSLSKHSIQFEEGMISQNYFVDIENEGFESIENPHEKARKDIKDLLKKVSALLDENYFDLYKDQLNLVVRELKLICEDIDQQWIVADYEANVKNIIHSCVDDYLRNIKEKLSAKDREIKEYDKKKRQIVDAVVTAIRVSSEDVLWPNTPPVLEGVTKNPKQGFCFNREAVYNGISMLESFFAKMFIKDYNSVKKIKAIDSHQHYAEAIRNCTSIADIDSKWTENFDRFISDATKTNDYIMDGANQQIGNTLGEMSLSYYKFYTQDDQNWKVLIVDQPEDNISNNNISQKLIGYFNSIRCQTQIIFVTHNPLLVVNLDADNVIFVENNNGDLSASNGCLEYEDEQKDILELIAQNMDGGKETIEKRLKVYGKNY